MLTQAIQLFDKGALDRAEDLFLHALETGESQEAFLYLARICFATHRPEEAAELLEQAAPQAPLALAQELMEDQEPQLAEPLCRLAVRQAPDSLEAHLWLGNALAAQDKLAPAVTAYEKAIALDIRAAMPRFCLAAALMWLGEFGRAASQVQVILQATPNNPDALWLRADLAFLQGDFRQAATEYQRVVEAGTVEPEIFERLAASWWNAGDRRRALDIYEAGFAVFPTSWDLYEAAALMCEEAGWYTKARRFHLALVYEPTRREAARAALARLEGVTDAAPAPSLIPVATTSVPKGPPARDSVTERLRANARHTGPLGRPGSRPL
jgi:tetratricopeptide (TPR) repeat protein